MLGQAIGSLWVELGLKIDDWERGMADFSKSLDAAFSETQKKLEGWDKLGSGLVDLGKTLSLSITTPLIGIGTVAVSTFSDFDSAMRKVSAQGDIFGSELASLEKLASDLGAATKFSSKEAAEGMIEYASAGFKATEITAAMAGTLDLAAAAGANVGSAATLTKDIIGQFGLTAQNTTHIADVLVGTMKEGSSSLGELSAAFKLAGPIAHTAGVSLEETAAAMVVLDKAGLRGTEAATGLRGTLASILSPSKQAAEALAELGVKTADSSGKLLPLSQIVQQFSTKLAGMSNEQQKMNLLFDVFGRESAPAAIALFNAGQKPLDEFTNKFRGLHDEAKTTAEVMNAGVGGSLEKMTGSIETTGIAFGKILAPAVAAVAGVIEGLANKATEFAEWFQKLPQPMQNAAIAATAFVAAVGPIALALGGAVLAFTSIAGAIGPIAGMIGITTTAFLGWAAVIPIAVAALAALGTWIAQNWSSITAVVNEAWSGVQEAWGAIWDGLSNWITGIWNNIATAAQSAFAPVSSFITNVWAGVESGWASIWNATASTLQGVWASIVSAGQSAFGPVVQFFSSVWDGIASYFASAWSSISKTLINAWQGIQKVASDVWAGVVKAIQSFIDWAEKIPGVQKLMNLDKAWDSAKKLETQLNKTADSTKDAATTAKTAGTAHQALASNVDKVTTSTSKAEKATRDHSKALAESAKQNEILYAVAKELKKQHDDHVQTYAKLLIQYADISKAIPQMTQPTDELNGAVQRLTSSVKLTTPEWIKSISTVKQELSAALKPVEDLDAAYKTLGITSAASLSGTADRAKEAYDKIKASGTATARDLDQAWVKYEKARIDAAIAAGQQVPQAQLDALKKMEDQLGASSTKQREKWGEFGKEVSTVITNASQDMVKALFEGSGSFAQKGLDVLTKLGEAVVSRFVEPFVKAGADLMSGIITDLMGGKGFGGLIDRVKDLGKTASDVFDSITKGTTAATTAAGGAANAGSGGGGGAIPGTSGAGSAAGAGVAGVVGAVGSVVSAITGVIGVFQSAHQETSLNAIEHNTRYTMMYVGERADGGILGVLFKLHEKLEFLQPTMDAIGGKLDSWLSPLPDAVYATTEQTFWSMKRLDQIGQDAQSTTAYLASINEACQWSLKRLDQIGNDVMYGSKADEYNGGVLDRMLSAISSRATQVSITITGATNPAATADAVKAKLQGALLF